MGVLMIELLIELCLVVMILAPAIATSVEPAQEARSSPSPVPVKSRPAA